jgi:RHS repeat-associated protein
LIGGNDIETETTKNADYSNLAEDVNCNGHRGYGVSHFDNTLNIMTSNTYNSIGYNKCYRNDQTDLYTVYTDSCDSCSWGPEKYVNSDYCTFIANNYSLKMKSGSITFKRDIYNSSDEDLIYLLSTYTCLSGVPQIGPTSDQINAMGEYVFNISCQSDSSFSGIKLSGNFVIDLSSPDNSKSIKINGQVPDLITNDHFSLSNSNKLYNPYRYTGNAEWTIKSNLHCNDNIKIIPSASNGFLTFSVDYVGAIACDLKITSLSAPNDGVSESYPIYGIIDDTSNKPVIWTLVIAGRKFEGSGKSVNVTWDGKDNNGIPVSSGSYTATLTANNGDGSCVNSRSILITVKSCSLKITDLIGTSKILDPSSGGNVGISGTISDSSDKSINWSLSVLDQTYSGTGKLVNASWNGKYVDGTVVQPGEYSAALTACTSDGLCTDSKTVNFTVTEAEDGQCGLYVQFGSSAHMASGNLSHSQNLFSSRGGSLPAALSLYYNSLDPEKGSLGRGWSHNYDLSLKENSNDSVLISEGNWRHKYYTLANGVYTGRTNNYSTLTKNSDGTFTLTHKDGQIYTFANGKIATIADRNGNTIAFAYSGGNLVTVTDPSGRMVTFTYDTTNHLTSLTDPSGNAYTFMVGDTLTSVTQPDGGTWRYTYDANSFMHSKADPLGNITSYAYDDQHRVTTATDPEGKTRSVTYPQTSDTVKSTSFTEKDGGVWSYRYDTSSGYLLSKTDPQGGTTSYGYNTNGNRTSTTNPDGTKTSATYDVTGNMLTSTDALGLTTGYAYNSFGQVTGVTDPQGGTTSYVYDAKGNITGLTDSSGATTTYVYDVKGNLTKVTDAAGLVTSFTYDAIGNLATVTDSSGANSTYGYDAAGNVTSITDAKGAVTTYAYDSRNRLIKNIDPNGNATLYSYDANGNQLSGTDANGNVTKYEYNSKNQLIKTNDALGNCTIYSYGGSSCPSCGGNGEKLTTITDANGNRTSYLYDQLGRLSKETDPKGNATSYAYDVKGNLTSKTDANGNTINYSYDANGRLLKKTYPDTTEESFIYDVKGNILTAVNKNITYNFSYDAAGRMVSSTDSNNRFLLYSYDNTGRKTKTIYPEGSIVSYAYDGTGRLATITNGGGRTYSYAYDKLGRRSKLTYPSGATANYDYDTVGSLTNLDHKTSGNKIITSFSYTHDKVGNHLTKSEPDTTWNYGYDAVYRILQALPTKQNKEKDEGSNSEKYSYDPVGNRLIGPQKQDNYSYGPSNQLLMDRMFAYSYDKNGNQMEKGKSKASDNDQQDNDSDQQDGKEWVYTYDFENRLFKAEQGDTVVTFKYDPLGRRIEKKVSKQVKKDDDDAVIHTYVYDGQAVILEYETTGDGRTTKTGTTKYVHGPGIDEPLAMMRDNEVYYFHTDGLGSVIALMDKKQKVVEAYEYDSFGYLKGDANPMQPFTYTGREWDKEIGLYYYRARYYDPMEGRFIQKDPIGFKGGINLYSYVLNNPLRYKDPYGQDVYVQNTTAVGGWHRRIVVDTPSGPYGISFGMSSRDAEMDGWSAASGDNPTPGGPGVGVVYPDNIDTAVKEVSRFSTTPCEDEVIAKYLKSLVGNTGQYHYLTNSCRNFSDREYANVVNMIMQLRAK